MLGGFRIYFGLQMITMSTSQPALSSFEIPAKASTRAMPLGGAVDQGTAWA